MGAEKRKKEEGNSSEEEDDPSYSPGGERKWKQMRKASGIRKGNTKMKTQKEMISKREDRTRKKLKTIEEDEKKGGETKIDEKKEDSGEKSKEDNDEKEETAKGQKVEQRKSKCEDCEDEFNTENELQEHKVKKHEIEELNTAPKASGKDLKTIPEVKEFYQKSSWFQEDKNHPTGITLRSKQREFSQTLPLIKKMLKKKEGNNLGSQKVKAVTVETKGEQEYTAIVVATKKTKKGMKTGKAVLRIYKTETGATLTLTTLRGSPPETAEEVGNTMERVIEKLIAGKETNETIKEIEEEDKEEELVQEKLTKLREKEAKEKRSCKLCKKVLLSESGLRKHVEKDHKVPCEVCKIRFKNTKDLEAHKERLHKIKETCTTCKKGFIDREDLRKHIRTRHLQNVVSECQFCKRSFYNEAGLEEHLETCMKKKEIETEELKKKNENAERQAKESEAAKKAKEDSDKENTKEGEMTAMTKKGGEETKKTNEDQKKDEKEEEDPKGREVTCVNCGEKVPDTEEGMKEHLEKHEVNRIGYTCNECTEECNTEEQMKKHMEMHEQKKCKECEVYKETEEEMKIHIKDEHEQKDCEDCKFTTSKTTELKAHILMGHQTKCKHCRVVVRNEEQMKTHIEEQHNKKYCKICKFMSTKEEELKAHNKMAHEVKCKDCNQICSGKKDLKSHIEAVHSAKKKKNEERPRTKKIPDVLKDIIDKDKVMLNRPGDGNCQIESIAIKAFGDKQYGPMLKRRVNIHIADNLEEYAGFGYDASEEDPFLREMGAGDTYGWQMASSREELILLLKEGNSLTMWGDQGEIKAAADLLKTEVVVYKVNRRGSEEATTVTRMNPKVKAEKMEPIELVLEEGEGHYYVVVKKEDYIAKGTVTERLENCEELIDDTTDQRKGDEGDEQQTKAKYQDQINQSNDKLREVLEENIKLKKEIKLVKSIVDLDKIENEQRAQMAANDEEDKKKKSYSEAVRRKKGGEVKKHEGKKDKDQYNCDNCQYQSEERASLMRHIMNCHKVSVNHECQKCDYSCDGTEEMKTHRKEQHMIECKTCQYKTEDEDKMMKHVKECHSEDKTEGSEDESTSGSEDENEEESLNEEVMEEEGWQFPCFWKKCQEGFDKREDLREHRSTKHKNPRECKWYKEGSCRFNEKSCTFTHSKAENSKKKEEIVCTICDLKVETMTELHFHRKKEHEANVRSCEYDEEDCRRGESCWLSHKSEEEREFEIKECRYGNKCGSIRNGRECWWLHKNPKPEPYQSKVFSKTPFHKTKAQNKVN